jgi:nitrogen fixation protein NifU and related proteins
MDLNSIYTELIMEHSQHGHNHRFLDDATHSHRGHNPSCGDDITLQIKLNENIIEEAAFSGVGCAISKASTSMMIDLITGKTREEALHLVEVFIGMIKKEITDESELEALEDALAFQNISNMPARVKCAVLAWHTLKQSLG